MIIQCSTAKLLKSNLTGRQSDLFQTVSRLKNERQRKDLSNGDLRFGDNSNNKLDLVIICALNRLKEKVYTIINSVEQRAACPEPSRCITSRSDGKLV
jgi:hypothetical protein